MAFHAYIEPTPTSGSGFFFRLKEALKQHQWVVYDSGGGTVGSYGNGADIITMSGPLRGAWYAIHSPTGSNSLPRRDFLFKLSDSAGQNRRWAVQYTEDGVGFVSGSPTEVVTASAAAPVPVRNGSFTIANFCPINVTYGTAIIVGDADENYSFFGGWISLSTGSFQGGLAFEGCTGSNPSKVDPGVVMCMGVVNNMFDDSGEFWTGGGFIGDIYAPYSKGTSRHRFNHVSPSRRHAVDGNQMLGFGTSSLDSSLDTFPIYFYRDGEQPSAKQTIGRSRIFRINGDGQVTNAKTFSRDGTRAAFSQVNIPWLDPRVISSSTGGSCALWIRADDSSINADGGLNIVEKVSGNNLGASASIQPTIFEEPTEFNGHAAIGFNGAEFLSTSINLDLASANNLTVFAVFNNKDTAGTTPRVLFELGSSGSKMNQFGFTSFINSGSADTQYVMLRSGSIIAEASASFTSLTASHGSGVILRTVFNPAKIGDAQLTQSFQRKNVNETYGTTSDVGTTEGLGTGILFLGAHGDSTEFLTGGISELIIYDHELSQSAIEKVEGYLYQRYIQAYGGV